jgi:hypothetical protein
VCLLAVTTGGSVLAIGTVHLPALLIVAALAFASLTLAIGTAIPVSRLLRSPPIWVGIGLSVYTLLQAIPIPMWLLASIAPSNADVWARALLPFGQQGPQWASISLDPGASMVEVLKWLTYTAVFGSASVLAAKRGAAWGIAIVFVSAILVAVTTVAHGLAGATKVFGIYEPRFAVAPWHVAPLLNANNLAGYLNLGAMCGLGLLVMRKPLFAPWLIGFGVAMIVGVDVTCASRAGFVALPLGILTFALTGVFGLDNTEERRNLSQTASKWLAAVAVGGGGVLALLGGTTETWRELYDKNLEKAAMLLWTKPMVREHPWFGIGRGAFEGVFPAYRMHPGNIVFTHPENFPSQWISEWGLPVGLLAMATFGWLFRPRNLGVTRSSLLAASTIGIGVVLLQNLFDLALEVPAVSAALACTLGSIWGDKKRRGVGRLRTTESIEPSSRRSAAIGVVALAGVGAIAAAARFGWHSLSDERESAYLALERLDVRAPGPVAEFRGQLRSAILRHPAEPYFPLAGAVVAWTVKDTSPIPWLQRSLERASLNGRAHFLLSEVLASRGARSQALLELRLAVQDDPELTGAAARAAVGLTKNIDQLRSVVPSSSTGAAFLETLAAQLGTSKDRELRISLNRESLDRDPSRPSPHITLAYELLEQLKDSSAPDCVGLRRQACADEILQHAAAIDRAQPGTSVATQIRASLLLTRGKADEAERLLADECGSVTDRLSCLYARATAAAKIKESSRLIRPVKELMGAGCGSPKSCAETATWVGDLMASRGDWGGASTYFSRASTEEPTESRWLKLAEAAAQLGAHGEAADALEKVAHLRGGADPALRTQIDGHRAKAMGRLVEHP